METKLAKAESRIVCPCWEKCGAAVVREYWAKSFYPYKDKRRNYSKEFCRSNKYPACPHFKKNEI